MAKGEKKGKKKRKPKRSTKVWEKYVVSSGKLERKDIRYCPKCGAGVLMAKHKDRWTCGKCGYTEFIK